MKKNSQKGHKDNEWNNNDPYDEETNGNGTNDGKPRKYKYYELDFLKKGESKPFKKYFKSKEDALKYYQNSSTYTLNKTKPNDPYNLNINRNYQGDLAETQFEFAGNTYKSMKNIKEVIKEKYKSEIGLSFRNPDDYIIDASNRLSPNLDTEFNTTGKDKHDKDLQKAILYRDYHGLAVDNENLVKESYNSNVETFYEYRGKKLYSVDELRSLYDNDIKACDKISDGFVDEAELKKEYGGQEEIESLKNWCSENSFEPKEINYYDYGGFLWPSKESVKSQIKKDIVTKYSYNGALDFDLSESDQASIVPVHGRPGLYAIYQNGGEGKLTAPSLVWTFDPKFKDTIRDKNQWEKEDEEQTLLDSAIGLLISTLVETHTSVETTKIAASSDKLDKWNPYDDIEALLGSNDRSILETAFSKYAENSAQNIVDSLKTVSDDVLLRGRKLSIFLYSMYDEVQSRQSLADRNDHNWEHVYARYLEKVVPHKAWTETVHEALYSEGSIPSRKKINSLFTLLIDPDRYSDRNYDNKFKISGTELTAYWKDKVQELRSNVQDGIDRLAELAESATKIAAKIGKIASVMGPIGMIIDFIDSFSIRKVSKYTFEYESTKPNKNGELVEDDTQSYKFSYSTSNWIWKDDDFDPDSQIRIVTLKEPSIGESYEVNNRLFNSEEYAQMYKKLTILDKLKEDAEKDSSKVAYGIFDETINIETDDVKYCLQHDKKSGLDCAVDVYFKQEIAKTSKIKYEDSSGELWDNKDSAVKHSQSIKTKEFLSEKNIAKMVQYRLRYPDGSVSDPNLVTDKYSNNEFDGLDANAIRKKKKEVILKLVDNIFEDIKNNSILVYWTDLLKTREFEKLKPLDLNKQFQKFKVYRYSQIIDGKTIKEFYFKEEIDAYYYILKINNFKNISVVYPCYEYRIFDKTFYNKSDYENYILSNLKECETTSLKEYEENVNT